MTIVLTNDDGIDAPGLAALKQALGDRGVVVAPAAHQSGCSHQVTTQAAIQIEQRSPDRWAIAGTPADCTRIALHQLYPQTQWVLSGINAGGNLGTDTYISGTVAAVREAVLHRVSGIAVSHLMRRGLAIDWQQAAQWTSLVLDKLMAQPVQPGQFWNVNLPHLLPGAPEPELVLCPLCTQPLPLKFVAEENGVRYAGVYPDRDRDPGADVAVCFGGNISITQVCLWDAASEL